MWKSANWNVFSVLICVNSVDFRSPAVKEPHQHRNGKPRGPNRYSGRFWWNPADRNQKLQRTTWFNFVHVQDIFCQQTSTEASQKGWSFRSTLLLRPTTWSRSTQKLFDWPASLEKVEASWSTFAEASLQKVEASVDVSKTHRFEFCNLFPIVLSNFCPNFLGWILKTFPGRNSSQKLYPIDTALRVHSRYLNCFIS